MSEQATQRIGVLIGRFQGYHSAHHELLRYAALKSDTLVVIIGSRNARKSPKNPFSAEEREQMIQAAIDADQDLNQTRSPRIIFRYINDHPNNYAWKKSVEDAVNNVTAESAVVTLFGCKKDESSFYLDLYPQWNKDLKELETNFSATELRSAWFANAQGVDFVRRLVDFGALETTVEWLKNRQYDRDLQDEWNYHNVERLKYAEYPYPETLNLCCADAVVICNGYVLMIERKHIPGKGCLALPGGFKNSNETFFNAAVRELYEETSIELAESILRNCNTKQVMFDKPSRSLGKTRVSMACYFDISHLYNKESMEFPLVQAGDDASNFKWVRIADLTHLRNVFDDHAAIVLSYN